MNPRKYYRRQKVNARWNAEQKARNAAALVSSKAARLSSHHSAMYARLVEHLRQWVEMHGSPTSKLSYSTEALLNECERGEKAAND